MIEDLWVSVKALDKPCRQFAKSVIIGKSLYLIGGRDSKDQSCFSSIDKYSIEEDHWERIVIENHLQISSLINHGIFLSPQGGECLIFGGKISNKRQASVYKLILNSMKI